MPQPLLHLTPPTLPSQPLISMMGTVVPPAPPLTGNVDPSKIEEIRRTVYVGNLNSSVSSKGLKFRGVEGSKLCVAEIEVTGGFKL